MANSVLKESRQRLLYMEAAIRSRPQIEIQVTHRFCRGLYIREMSMLKGTLAAGKIHRHENLSIISKGEVSIFADGVVTRVSAPYTFIAPPGTKRIAYAHEDTIWTNIHATNETDLVKLEAELIAESFDDPAFDVLEWEG